MGGTSQLISFTFGPVIGILSDRFGCALFKRRDGYRYVG